MSVAEAIKERARPRTVYRWGEGWYDEHGRWNEAKREVVTLLVYLQPARPHEKMELPENRRTEATLKFFSESELYGTSVKDQRNPDVIEYKGDQYEVTSVKDWSEEGGFFKGLAVKM
jgi:hypothetical protein